MLPPITLRPADASQYPFSWVTREEPCTKRLTETDEGDEETDTGTNSHNERLGHDTRQPLTKTQQRENQEDPSAQEYV